MNNGVLMKKTTLVVVVLMVSCIYLTGNLKGADGGGLLNYLKNVPYRTYSVGRPDDSLRDPENNFLGHVMSIKQHQTSKNYIAEMDELNMQKVNMDDPRLINLIRNYWLENPSVHPYDLKHPDVMNPSIGQAGVVDSSLKFKEGGFYVECGALDGETRSNTLMFERLRKWNGILIEADPANYALLKKKHRKAFTINACLSGYPYPVKMHFRPHSNTGQLVKDKKDGGTIEVQCFPLISILLAANVTHIDFFSLDVEGAELSVLKTVPSDKVDIDMMTVEFSHVKDGEGALKQFVEKRGYSSVLRVSHYYGLANDIIFQKRGH